MTWRTIEVLVLCLCGKLHTDSAVTDEVAGLVEHRLPAYPKFLMRAIGIDAAEYEIQEWLPARNLRLKDFSLRLIPARPSVIAAFTYKCVDPDSEHFQDRTGYFGEVPGLVLLPVPIGGQFGQAAIARFAFAQFGGPFLDRLFQRLVVILQLLYNSRTSSMLWMRVLTSTRSNGLLMKSFAPACNARSL